MKVDEFICAVHCAAIRIPQVLRSASPLQENDDLAGAMNRQLNKQRGLHRDLEYRHHALLTM